MSRGLGSRLFRSHLAVMGLAILAMFVLGAVLAPIFFGPEFENFGPDGVHRRPPAELRSTFGRAMFGALVVGVAGAAAAAAIMARAVARRLAGSIKGVADATRRLAQGDYATRAPRPDTTELAHLADDVNSLAAQLQETEERRLRLIGDVAHELRTPLTTIEGSMEALMDGVLEPTDQVFATVAREAERLKRLAIDLSSLSQAGEASHELHPIEVDLGELVRSVTERLRQQFDAKEVDLGVTTASVTVTADADRLVQVVTNVVGNALTYTPAGGSVAVSIATMPDTTSVVVTDSGAGIAVEHLDRIFERFVRLDEHTTTGTGVGLTIARTLARRMGGDVTATSPGPGMGSTFTITLRRS